MYKSVFGVVGEIGFIMFLKCKTFPHVLEMDFDIEGMYKSVIVGEIGYKVYLFIYFVFEV